MSKKLVGKDIVEEIQKQINSAFEETDEEPKRRRKKNPIDLPEELEKTLPPEEIVSEKKETLPPKDTSVLDAIEEAVRRELSAAQARKIADNIRFRIEASGATGPAIYYIVYNYLKNRPGVSEHSIREILKNIYYLTKIPIPNDLKFFVNMDENPMMMGMMVSQPVPQYQTYDPEKEQLKRENERLREELKERKMKEMKDEIYSDLYNYIKDRVKKMYKKIKKDMKEMKDEIMDEINDLRDILEKKKGTSVDHEEPEYVKEMRKELEELKKIVREKELDDKISEKIKPVALRVDNIEKDVEKIKDSLTRIANSLTKVLTKIEDEEKIRKIREEFEQKYKEHVSPKYWTSQLREFVEATKQFKQLIGELREIADGRREKTLAEKINEGLGVVDRILNIIRGESGSVKTSGYIEPPNIVINESQQKEGEKKEENLEEVVKKFE